ncbi:MAG: polyprenol monophosphomannose synthase [Mobiluncus sp.]|uniref:polyprenol monophosphomannose synthase n=1 Tax=Mobiluncus sp. TaxID=47293 RepID=UPI00258BAC54|nr:polyprenol monophosphomannose synthase [Mobiluncus sp.]MCI6585373.1 polyprenol monophosphomannose synthase [Mobiluncus sp.]
MTQKTLIAIPTYNESENLEYITSAVFSEAPEVEILIVDDNSPDGTGELADTLSKTNPRLHVLHRQGKEGLGPAYLAAFQWASENGFTWVGEFDADGSHRPADLPRLLHLSHGTTQPDLVIGSRWTRGGGTDGWSKRRELLSRAGSLYVNAVLGVGVADTTAGFRVYRVDFLDKLLGKTSIESKGYGFQIEMTWRTQRAGGRIKEVPITFVERRAGTSKMSGSIIKEAFIEVLKWRWRELIGR